MKLNKSSLKNVNNSKLTTGMGLAMIMVIIMRLCGINPEKYFGIDSGDIILYIGSVFASILLLFSRDP
jgi:hypothetical protein